MNFKYQLASILFVTYLFLAGSCGKDNAPPPAPPEVDTLGTGWQKITVPGVPGLIDIFFINAQTGYICGEDYIAKSTDGGLTWTKQVTPPGLGRIINLYFINATNGWATGGKYVLKTTDGGITWKKITIPDPAASTDVQFLNQRLGYIATTEGLFKSTDSGNTWIKTPATIGSTGGLYFSDSSTGWVTHSYQIKKTGNAGVDFTALTNISPGSYVTQFVDPLRGWVAGGGYIQRTIDGGVTWNNVPTRFNWDTDIHFFDQDKGFVMDNSHVYKTSDGGATLTRVVKLVQGDLVECHFTDEQHGWAVSAKGFVLRYVQ
jgi:photosystem II stability/assembly factor-like uncharacterized protein